MTLESLRILLYSKRLSQSSLATAAKVSRQAVSRWFSINNNNVESRVLTELSKQLKVSIDFLMHTTSVTENAAARKKYETTLLWDHAYENLEAFCVALARQELKAVARLVQVYGLYSSASIVGRIVWKEFDKYEKYIHPIRRMECEKIWKIHQSLA